MSTDRALEAVVKREEARLRLEYPTPSDVPGCISLLDSYLACGALRSQVKAIYRYGHRAECTSKWEDVKFCMSLKALHPEEQREQWIARRAMWWAKRRLGKSSEDIWDIRTEPLQSYPAPLTDGRPNDQVFE